MQFRRGRVGSRREMGSCTKKDTDAEKLNTRKNIEVYLIQMPCFFQFFFSLYHSFVSRALTTHMTAGEGRGIFFYSNLPLPLAHEHSDICVQLCT